MPNCVNHLFIDGPREDVSALLAHIGADQNTPAFDYDGAIVTFKTPWTPPTNIIVALSKMFPKCTLRFEHFERGTMTAGGFTIGFEWETDSFNGYQGC
jgi:hypothetical protein